MGVADDLLEQAVRLATSGGANGSQIDLRRAVSSAYYALFHLLAEETSSRWQPESAATVTGIQRSLDHGLMDQVSSRFTNSHWEDWHRIQHAVPPELQRVAKAFCLLQDDRHLADYDNHEHWTRSDVEGVLKKTQGAFQDWATIRSHPMAGNYLLSMLLGKRR